MSFDLIPKLNLSDITKQINDKSIQINNKNVKFKTLIAFQ